MQVLVVEDDQALARILVKSIESAGHTAEVSHDGEQGLELARSGRHDAVILDLMLPRLSGVELCRRLRAEGRTVPVLMLTARSAVSERIEGLDAGADDYLVKPFSLGELQARLRALSRRGSGPQPDVIEAWELQLDVTDREASSNVVDIYIHYVRRKLKAAGLQRDPIRTVRGLGYAFRKPE